MSQATITDSIPKDIEIRSHADYVALCYTYNFILEMDSVFNDCADLHTVFKPETQEFIRQVERSFSRLSVYLYQRINRGERQYKGMALPEPDKWLSTGLVNEIDELRRMNESYFYEGELKPNLE